MSEVNPADLESLLIPRDKWEVTETIPSAALALALAEIADLIPTGIGRHPELGWFVLQSSGQGPYLIWTEVEDGRV